MVVPVVDTVVAAVGRRPACEKNPKTTNEETAAAAGRERDPGRTPVEGLEKCQVLDDPNPGVLPPPGVWGSNHRPCDGNPAGKGWNEAVPEGTAKRRQTYHHGRCPRPGPGLLALTSETRINT